MEEICVENWRKIKNKHILVLFKKDFIYLRERECVRVVGRGKWRA